MKIHNFTYIPGNVNLVIYNNIDEFKQGLGSSQCILYQGNLMLRILIIEHDIRLRERIKKILISKLPFISVAEASDENETFSEIEKKRPDLIIMDIRLSGESGLGLTEKIKIRYPLIPIAVNTNNDSLEYKNAAVQLGADYFFSKKSNSINELASLAEYIFLKDHEDTIETYECG